MRYINISVQQSDIKIKKELNFNQVPLTCGSVNDIACRFAFSKEWDEYPVKVAIFSGSGKSITTALTDDTAVIPWEVLTEEGGEITVGIVGLCDLPDTNSYKQLNTEYVSLGIIVAGADISIDKTDNAPTPDTAEQLLLAVNGVIKSEKERNEKYADIHSRLSEAEKNLVEMTEHAKNTLSVHMNDEIMSDSGAHNFRIKNKLLEFFDGQEWRNVELERNYKIMTAYLTLSASSSISYGDDATGLSPGDVAWDNFFGHYPVLLKNGKEIGKLMPNDFSKFEDGTPITIDDSGDYDVCIAFPRRGIRIERRPNDIKISMTDHPDLYGFEYNAHRYQTTQKNIFYVGAYLASTLETPEGNTVISSLPNKEVSILNTLDTAKTYAKNKNALLFSYYQLLFIQCMYVLKYQNLDCQRTVCQGFTAPDNSIESLVTGITDEYGMDSSLLETEDRFSGNFRAKLLGLEDLYGTIYQWLDGIFSIKNYVYVYWGNKNVSSITTISGYSEGFPSDVVATTKAGFFPNAFEGSNSTYYSDWAVVASGSHCIVGGDNIGGYSSGIFCLRLNEQPEEENKVYDKAARIMYL